MKPTRRRYAASARESTLALIVLRDVVPAGVLLGDVEGDTLHVHARFLFFDEAELFRQISARRRRRSRGGRACAGKDMRVTWRERHASQSRVTDRLLITLTFLCAVQVLLAPSVLRAIRRRKTAPSRAVRVLAVIALVGSVAVFHYLAQEERSVRLIQFRGSRLGDPRERFEQRWGTPSDALTIEELERRWGYRAVEERGDRRTAVTYAVWWGALDVATARVVGFDRDGRAVLLSWGGT